MNYTNENVRPDILSKIKENLNRPDNEWITFDTPEEMVSYFDLL